MAEEAPTTEPTSEEPAAPSEPQKSSEQLKKSKGSNKSLSTIPEEPSSKTDHDFSFSSTSEEYSGEEAQRIIKTPLPFPPLPEPISSREKRHTSTLLKHTSRSTIVPHDRPRTASMQERLLTHIQCTGKPLFSTVLGDQKQPAKKTASILITGFGLRNLASLQEALQIDEHNKLKQLYRGKDGSTSVTTTTESSFSIQFQKTESTSETQTDESARWECAHKRKLMYLMGLHEIDEGEEESVKAELPEVEMVKSEEGVTQLSESMKYAQKYLRVHKIFEFFQFIIAHLLSALPENPVAFIIDILDKCLIYRAGLTEPPLLYNRRHLEALFYLMDRMRTGYIELEQYKTGMRTLGICSFNQKPYRAADGMVPKEDFIEEAYDCLSHLLTDMIKRRWIRTPPPITPPPPPTPQISTAATSSADEYPSNRFTRTRLFLD